MNYRGIVAYRGTAYSGFQRQKNRPSIQGELERVLSFLLGQEIAIAGAGRTDAGVHALGQTFSFVSPKQIRSDFLQKANHLLPKDIEIKRLEACDDSFHARHSSVAKEYLYRLLPNGRRPFESDTLAQIERTDFDGSKFRECIPLYLGTHDFRNFTTKQEDVDGFVRTISKAELVENNGILEISFRGNGFMTYQVRIMVGVAIKVALSQMSLEQVRDALNPTGRRILSFKAPAGGLYLKEVFYGE